MEEKENKKMNEEEMQQKYMELQMMSRHIKAAQQQLEGIDEQIGSMGNLVTELDNLKEAKEGSEMLSPIGEGIFVRSKLADNNQLIVNVGANVAVTKNVDEAKQLLKTRIEQGQRHKERMITEVENMIEEAKLVEKELASMME